MRIDHLHLKNFKLFEDRKFSFHPQFNLIVGVNGTGKTSLLDALAIAAGSWFLGIPGTDSRHIRPHEVTKKRKEHIQKTGSSQSIVKYEWFDVYPCEVSAVGSAQEKNISWKRTLNRGGRTTYSQAKMIKDLAIKTFEKYEKDEDVIFPLVSYYGTGRLWQIPKDEYQINDPMITALQGQFSRLDGYRNSIDPRISVARLTHWIAKQEWIEFQEKTELTEYTVFKKALLQCVEGAQSLEFDAKIGEVVMTIDGIAQPFSNLSDGQRCMLALVGDIAEKAFLLNPHLGEQALQETPGIVLIDELDLHLHPKWQRTIIDNLRTVFPKIQFFATTHSPFLIQSLRSGDELVMLDDAQTVADLANLPIEEIAQGIQHIDNPQVSARYENMKQAAKHYLEILEDRQDLSDKEKLEEFKKRLAESIAPYADNPAYQAFLEMERIGKLGE